LGSILRLNLDIVYFRITFLYCACAFTLLTIHASAVTYSFNEQYKRIPNLMPAQMRMRSISNNRFPHIQAQKNLST
jgi:hypothetical protein